LEKMLLDSNFRYADQINTPQVETMQDAVLAGFKKGLIAFKNWEQKNPQKAWAHYQNTQVNHLLKLSPFSNEHLLAGGGKYCLNATQTDHGPSWRMVVSLTPDMRMVFIRVDKAGIRAVIFMTMACKPGWQEDTIDCG
jgi:penicillin amidase